MKNNFIKYIFVVFVVILLAFSIYKINSDKKEENNKTSENENTSETNMATDIRLAIVNYDTINPILSNNYNVHDLSRIIFDPLINLSNNYKPEPCLATEWSKSGDSSYILKLRDDVKWHDGSKFTSKDVQFTIDQIRNNNSVYSSNVANITKVEIIDDYTIKFTLDNSGANFEYNLNFPILSNNFYLEQDFRTTEKNNIPMGTGMYKIVSNEGGIITLKKNQNWWNIGNKNAKIEEIKVNLYSSMGDAYNAFKMGNLDLLQTQNSELEKYVGTIGYKKVDYKGREYDFLAMNCSNNILIDQNVRKAISYSIDRENIVATVYGGKYYCIDFPLDFGMWLYNSENSSSEYNPDQAKQLLINSGWEYTKGNWQKKENYKYKRLTLNLMVNSDNPQRAQVAEIIKNNLETVGIKVNINNVPNSVYFSNLGNKKYDLALAGTNIGITPNLSTYFGENNIFNYNNEEIKNILKDISNISNENLLKDKYNRIVEIYKDEAPIKSLYINQKTLIYNTNLMADIKPNNYNIFYNIENWYREI